MALSFACVDESRIGASRIISMSLANRLVSFVSRDSVDGPDADAAVALRSAAPVNSLLNKSAGAR